jgi:hypothetical protein
MGDTKEETVALWNDCKFEVEIHCHVVQEEPQGDAPKELRGLATGFTTDPQFATIAPNSEDDTAE